MAIVQSKQRLDQKLAGYTIDPARLEDGPNIREQRFTGVLVWTIGA
jgi:hypothetical protein